MIGFVVLFAAAGVLVVVAGVVAVVRGLRYPPRKTAGVAMAWGEPTEPSEAGFEGEAIELRLSDGATSPGWWLQGGDADGPMAVVCHGFGDSKYGAMGSWAGRVIGRCGGVVVYDNRGQGESTAKTADGSLGEAADLAAVVGQVAAMRPGAAAKGVVVVGYSMGANAAIRAVAAMRAAGGDGCGRDGGGVEVVGLMADSPYRRWDGPVRRVFAMNRWPAWPVVGLTGVWLRIGRRWEDTAAVAERLGARLAVLVVGTEADELVGLEDVRAIAAAAERGGADAELLAFEEGRHLAGWDVDRAAYEAAIDRLFDKVAARRGLVQG